MLSIQKTFDEAIGAPERAVVSPDGEVLGIGASEKAYKPKIQGDEVVGYDKLTPEESPFSALTSDTGYKSGVKVTKPVFEELGTPVVPASQEVIPAQIGKEVTETVRPGDNLTNDFRQAQSTKEIFTRLGNKYGPDEVPELQHTLRQAAKGIDEKLTNPSGSETVNKLAKEFGIRNKNYSDLSDLFQDMGLKMDKNNVWTDSVSGQQQTSQQIRDKIINFISRADSSEKSGIATRDKFKNLIDTVSQSDYKLAKTLQQDIGEQAKDLEIATIASKFGLFNPATYPKSGSAQLGNAIGWGIKEMVPEEIVKFSGQVAKYGGETGKKFAGKIKSISEKDEIGRNAMIFALEQDPEYRKMMAEMFKGVANSVNPFSSSEE